jgi:hypothetical protein
VDCIRGGGGCCCLCVYENVQRGLDPVWRCPIGGEGHPEREGGNRLGFVKSDT